MCAGAISPLALPSSPRRGSARERMHGNPGGAHSAGASNCNERMSLFLFITLISRLPRGAVATRDAHLAITLNRGDTEGFLFLRPPLPPSPSAVLACLLLSPFESKKSFTRLFPQVYTRTNKAFPTKGIANVVYPKNQRRQGKTPIPPLSVHQRAPVDNKSRTLSQGNRQSSRAASPAIYVGYCCRQKRHCEKYVVETRTYRYHISCVSQPRHPLPTVRPSSPWWVYVDRENLSRTQNANAGCCCTCSRFRLLEKPPRDGHDHVQGRQIVIERGFLIWKGRRVREKHPRKCAVTARGKAGETGRGVNSPANLGHLDS